MTTMEKLQYNIQLSEHNGVKYVHAQMRGILSDEARNRIAVETIQEMRKHNVNRVLWDVSEAELDYSLVKSHMVIVNLAKLGIKMTDYIAVTYFYNEKHHKHAHTVAQNRGIKNIEYFTDRKAAIEWLTTTTTKS
jgi:hypothetical protein